MTDIATTTAETEKKFPPELTKEENLMYAEAAEQLAKKHNVSKVHPIVQIVPETFERVVCYITEPNYITKVRVMDKATTIGVYSAAEEMRQACLLPEPSDPISYGESPECDRFKMGVLDECLTMIKRLQNQFKKK